jgi:hypothetical protein
MAMVISSRVLLGGLVGTGHPAPWGNLTADQTNRHHPMRMKLAVLV